MSDDSGEMKVIRHRKVADYVYEVETESKKYGRVTRRVLVLPEAEIDPAPPVTPQHDLATKVSPAIVAVLVAHKNEIIANSGGILVRWAINAAYPSILNEVPVMTESALDVVALQLKDMTIVDLLNWINTRAAQALARQS